MKDKNKLTILLLSTWWYKTHESVINTCFCHLQTAGDDREAETKLVMLLDVSHFEFIKVLRQHRQMSKPHTLLFCDVYFYYRILQQCLVFVQSFSLYNRYICKRIKYSALVLSDLILNSCYGLVEKLLMPISWLRSSCWVHYPA